MAKVDQHISDLLYCYDCVVVPEFGGFITNYEPARIDKARKLVHPPSKSILFNKNIRKNDGLLASKIAQEEHISYENSNLKISKYVEACKDTLKKTGRLELENIGVLYQDQEQNVRFIQSSNNYLTTSFGLPRVDFIPVEVESVKEEIKQPSEIAKGKETPVIPFISENQTTQPTEKQPETKIIPIATKPEKVAKVSSGSKKRGAGFWAAAVLLPLFLAYAGLSFWNSGVYYSGEFQTAALNPINWFSWERNYVQRTNDPVLPLTKDTTNVSTDAAPIIEEYEAIIPVAETTHVEIEVMENLDIAYHVIGGCFSKEKNATHFVEEMLGKGFKAEIIGIHKGLHRVSIGQASSRKQARAIRDEAKEQAISCWILKN